MNWWEVLDSRGVVTGYPDGRRERTVSLEGRFRLVESAAVLRFFGALSGPEESSTGGFQNPTGKRFAPSGL